MTAVTPAHSVISLLRHYLALPAHVSSFEAGYLRRLNRIALLLFWLHVPVFTLIAVPASAAASVAFGLTVAVVIGPTIAFLALPNRPRLVSCVHGFTAMAMGGVLVYIVQGPVQIEMHFYFFVLIALLAVFANPQVVLVAAVTVAAHHLAFFLIAPDGVFNYDATIGSVAIHALFVVLESVAACFVARSFFDNVIGLEKIVTARTAALDNRNRDFALIFDNVAQGFVTVGLDGTIGGERSAALIRWFGEPTAGVGWWDYVAGDDEDTAAWIRISFETLVEGFMPLEVVLDQLPKRVVRDGRHLRVEYRAIGEPVIALLAVVTDITDELARAAFETSQRELITVVAKAQRDASGFAAFVAEADQLVERITAVAPPAEGAPAAPTDDELAELRRRLHTLKGNAALFGVTSIAELCHELEGVVDANPGPLEAAPRAQLAAAWAGFHERVDPVLGLSKRRAVVIDWEEYQSFIASLGKPEPAWAAPMRRWAHDPARPHLERFAAQATALADRLGKAPIEVEIADHDVRVAPDRFMPLWQAAIHAVRNAVDHGLEPAADRTAAGKRESGRIALRTEIDDGALVLEIVDDGRGIDWDKVAERARLRGLPAETRAELEEALFASGVSTAAETTDVSGRGVGLDALRVACRGLGGRVELASELGAGSTIRCVVPLAAPLLPGARTRSASLRPLDLARAP